MNTTARAGRPGKWGLLFSTAIIALTVGLAHAEDSPYCRSYDPSTRHLSISLPASLKAKAGSPFRFSAAALKYATLASFIEQMALAVMAGEDEFLGSLRVQDLSVSAKAAAGFGGEGSHLMEPGDLPDVEGIPFEVVDTDGFNATTDERGQIRIERGLIDRIVAQAVERIFGSREGYVRHIKAILSMTDTPPGLVLDPSPTDVRNFVDTTINSNSLGQLPIGEIFKAGAEREDNPFGAEWRLGQEITRQLLFVGAHEAGHARNGHKRQKGMTCEQFTRNEKQADAFAAGMLANFDFNMGKIEADKEALDGWTTFFQYYRDIGLGAQDNSGCTYPAPEERAEWVKKSYKLAFDAMVRITYSAVDYSTPNPGNGTCTDGVRTWRKEG